MVRQGGPSAYGHPATTNALRQPAIGPRPYWFGQARGNQEASTPVPYVFGPFKPIVEQEPVKHQPPHHACRCVRVGPGADAAELSPVLAQMWQSQKS